MSKISVPIELIINQALHQIAEEYDMDVRVVTEIIKEYDHLVAPHLTYRFGAEMLFGVN